MGSIQRSRASLDYILGRNQRRRALRTEYGVSAEQTRQRNRPENARNPATLSDDDRLRVCKLSVALQYQCPHRRTSNRSYSAEKFTQGFEVFSPRANRRNHARIPYQHAFMGRGSALAK